MRLQLIFLIIVVHLISSRAYAGKHVIIMGGGGAPESSESTLFDPSVKNIGNFLQNSQWDTQIIFNGGHSQTEAIIKEKFAKASMADSFSSKNFNSLLDSYEKKISKGQIKAGEQLLILIDSHGAPKQNDELTHQIASTPAPINTTSTDKQTDLVSLDRLKKISELALQKNIKLAIIDLSCHSGNTQSLSNKNTCVISATGAEHLAFDTFSQSFTSKMEKGKNLESLFLETRLDDSTASFPMISSKESQAIVKDFYPLLSPYFYQYDNDFEVDSLTEYILQNSDMAGICKRESLFKKLMDELNSLKQFSLQSLNIITPEVEDISKLIKEYKKKQDRFINLVHSWDIPDLKQNEEITGIAKLDNFTFSYKIKYTWADLLGIDFPQLIQGVTDELKIIKKDAHWAELNSTLDSYNIAFAKQQEIIKMHPNLLTYKENLREQMRDLESSKELVKEIAKKERIIYDRIYSDLRSKKPLPDNPCKSFVL